MCAEPYKGTPILGGALPELKHHIDIDLVLGVNLIYRVFARKNRIAITRTPCPRPVRSGIRIHNRSNRYHVVVGTE
jgi:hypothetical protein